MYSYGIFLIIIFTRIQFSRAVFGLDKWIHFDTVNVSDSFRIVVLGMSLYDFVVPEYPARETIQIPGGECPKEWVQKWDDIKLASDHKLDLNFWFRWPGNMLNVVIENDLKHPLNQEFFQTVKYAVLQGIVYFEREFRENATHWKFDFFQNLKQHFQYM